MDVLGQQNKIHVIPNKRNLDRPFHQLVKRCDDSLNKISAIEKEMKEINL